MSLILVIGTYLLEEGDGMITFYFRIIKEALRYNQMINKLASPHLPFLNILRNMEFSIDLKVFAQLGPLGNL